MIGDDVLLTLAPGISVRGDDEGWVQLEKDSGQRVRIGEAAFALTQYLDGATSLAELRRVLQSEGVTIDDATIQAVVQPLVDVGLLIPVSASPRETLPGGKIHCIQCPRSRSCCFFDVGPLETSDIDKVAALDWEGSGLTLPKKWVEKRGDHGYRFLVRAKDGPCVFLDPDGLCRIHKHFGEAAKPLPCRLYPLVPVRTGGRLRIGLDYDCVGLAHGGEPEATTLEAEADRLKDVIDAAVAGTTYARDPDPKAKVSSTLEARDDEATPLTRFRALGDVIGARSPDGDMTLTSLLNDLLALAKSSGGRYPIGWPRDRLRAFIAAIEASQDGRLVRLPEATDASSAIRDYHQGFVSNAFFLTENASRFGMAIELTTLIIAWTLGAHHGSLRAQAEGRATLSCDDMGHGVSTMVAALRCLRRVEQFHGAGATLIDEALAWLASTEAAP